MFSTLEVHLRKQPCSYGLFLLLFLSINEHLRFYSRFISATCTRLLFQDMIVYLFCILTENLARPKLKCGGSFMHSVFVNEFNQFMLGSLCWVHAQHLFNATARLFLTMKMASPTLRRNTNGNLDMSVDNKEQKHFPEVTEICLCILNSMSVAPYLPYR